MANNALVQSLQRGMTILDLVARSGSGLTLMEIADALSVKRPTAFNLTRTLVAQRYLVKTTKPVRFLLGAGLATPGDCETVRGTGPAPLGRDSQRDGRSR